MQGVTFPVSAVAACGERKLRLEPRKHVENVLHFPVEAMAIDDPELVCCSDIHPLVLAAKEAFYGHYPLELKPDDIWFCIAQGFAHHVASNAESLRRFFVSHSGKLTLTVERPDFALGRQNPWPELFTSFSGQIGQHVGDDLRRTVVGDFSTTTPFHRAATEVALMDTFQPYFEYEVMCGCGIPEITLAGTAEDWRKVRQRAERLAKFGLEQWIAELLPVLNEFEAAIEGKVKVDFWKSFFRHDSTSWGSTLTGWINVLFPYLKSAEEWRSSFSPNPHLRVWKGEWEKGLNPSQLGRFERIGPGLLEFPSGLSSAPVRVIEAISGISHDMRFVAGMFGVTQDAETLRLMPSFGWAVVHTQPIQSLPPRRGWWSRMFRSN